MKPCPFCGEQIQPAAVKCRFCGEWLDPSMRPAWSGSDLAALTEQITREVTRQLDPSGGTRPPRKRSSTRDIPSDPHRAGVIAPDESGARAGSVEFDPHPQPEPRTPPAYEEPGPYPGLGHQADASGYDIPPRTLGQPAPRAARWTPGTVREESGPKSAIAGPSWSPPLSPPEPEPRDSDPVWQPPEWLTPAKRQPSPPESAEPPSWSPPLASPSPAPKPTWAPPSLPQTPPVPAVAWTPPQPQARAAEPALPAQAIRPSAVAPSEDEYVDGGFASEFDDDEFDDGPGSDDEFPPLDLAAQSGRHRKRRRRLDQPAIEIPVQASSAAAGPARGRERIEPVVAPLPISPAPGDALGDDDDFADEPPVAAKAKPAPAGKSERPKAKQPRDEDDDDFDDDDDDDDDDDFGDDDDEDPAANSSSQLGASVTAPKDKAGGRKLPWIPITAASAGLVLVLAFAFRDKLFGPADDSDAADAAAESGSEASEPAAEPDPEPKAEDKAPPPEPKPEPKPPAIPTEELDAKIAEATSLVNRQKFDDARVILDEVLGKIPNEGRALALLAQTHLEKNKLEDALATANDCVAADPGQAFCWIVIATVEQGNDNLPRALEAYRKYLEVEPDGQHAKSAKKQIPRLEGKIQG